jgi:HNH endonuclease
MTTRDDAITFYETNYDLIGQWLVRPRDKIMLGDKKNRVCRFCGKRPPEVTFKKKAHAIPESPGNKSIATAYECDACNELFGTGIETDFGNWSKPMRTMARIRGKNGVPTIKKVGTEPGWRIEHGDSGFRISSYEHDPPYVIEEANKRITFKLHRDPYTPVAVLKAFMKMGVSLMPESEVANFRDVIAWIRDRDHSRSFAGKAPIFYALQPGPMPNDLIAALILRRKPHIEGLPYAFFVLGYGNEVFQVMLPSREPDAKINNQQITMPPFPTPGSPFPERFPQVGRKLIDLTGRDVVKGEVWPITMGYEEMAPKK